MLTARQLLVQAQTNYAQAKYGYLNNIIALRLAAGNLDPLTIKQINGWLVEPPPPVPEATPGPGPAPTMLPPSTAPLPPPQSAPATVPAAAPAPPGTP